MQEIFAFSVCTFLAAQEAISVEIKMRRIADFAPKLYVGTARGQKRREKNESNKTKSAGFPTDE